jgi:beta-barrel assembly-enhancing protease
MDKSYKIQYSDGQTAQSQAATLWLRDDSWEIHMASNGNANPKVIHWEMSKVFRNETKNKVASFSYGNSPFQTIECVDADFPKAIKAVYPQYKLYKKGQFSFLTQGFGSIITFALVFLGILGALYFWILPKTVGYLANKLPMQYEIQLGEKLAESMMKDMKIDSSRTLALQDFSSYIDFQTNYPLDFTVVHSDDINAFALPGGKIVVFDRLLDKINSSEALASLLAHEATHVKKRHSLQGLARTISGYLFLSLIFGDLSGLTAVFIENANYMNTLGYTRNLEHEADVMALETLAHNHLNQQGMVDLLDTLQSESKNGEVDLKTFQFLSSHPLTEDRITYAKEALKSQGAFTKNEGLETAFLALKR